MKLPKERVRNIGFHPQQPMRITRGTIKNSDAQVALLNKWNQNLWEQDQCFLEFSSVHNVLPMLQRLDLRH